MRDWRRGRLARPLFAWALGLWATGTVAGENPLLLDDGLHPGPYRGTVLRIIDADTIEVEADIWPGLDADVSVRIAGVDAPETRTTCAPEERLGEAATAFVEKRLEVGEIIRLRDVQRGSFAGRVVADVARWRSDRWLDLATELLKAELALPHEDGSPTVPWCLIATEREAVQ